MTNNKKVIFMFDIFVPKYLIVGNYLLKNQLELHKISYLLEMYKLKGNKRRKKQLIDACLTS